MSFDETIEQVLRNGRNTVRIPVEMDEIVLSRANARQPGRRTGLRLPAAAGLGLLTCALLLSLMLLPGRSMERECRGVFSEMVRAVENRDVGRSLSFYSFKDSDFSRNAVEQNIRTFYGRYDRISYKIKDLKVRASGQDAVAVTTYELVARNERETVKYAGTDRIYFHREDGQLLIRHWIDG